MLKSLPTLRFTLGTFLLFSSGNVGGPNCLCGQENASSFYATPPQSAAPVVAPDPIPSSGQKLVAAAAKQMVAEPSLEAKIRQRVNFNGHELFGTGIYQQLGTGPEKLLRLELKTQLDDQTVTLQQICSDRFFWIRKDMPQGRKSLSRVSLWQFREAVDRAVELRPNIPDVAGGSWMMLGGLSRMLQELNLAYEFKPEQPGKLGSVPVWIIEGSANEKLRTRLNIAENAEPPQFAQHITLTLGRDEILPLFPYRVEYQHATGQERSTVMALEFYEVRRRSDLDPRSFDYNPGDQEVEDVTKFWLGRMGLR